MPGKLLPLAFLPEGSRALIREIRGGYGVSRRLAELGFTLNAEVKVVRSSSPGPILVEIKGSRIALGRGIAMKILVEEVK